MYLLVEPGGDNLIFFAACLGAKTYNEAKKNHY
jgi:hypothetical protein